MALCRWSTAVQVLEEVSRMVMLIMLMLMLMLVSMLMPRLQTKTALSRVSRVAEKKVKGMAKKYDASDTLIKQIPRLLGPGLKKVGSNIYEAIIAGIIDLYRIISILMQFLAGRKVPLTGDSDNLNVWFIQA